MRPMASAVAATSPSCSIKRVSRYQFDPETDVIGKGAYGEVYRATLIKPKNENGTGGETAAKNGSVFALKKTMCGSKEEGMPVSTIREIMVLKEIGATMQRAAQDATSDTLGFENIVPLYDVCMEKDVVYMASEYCDAGDLASYLKKQPRHRLSDRWQYRRWMRDLLHGLCFLHRKEISHRDLKPQNLVLKTVPNKEDTKGVSVSGGEEEEPTKSTRYVLKITDFGLSRVEGIPVKKYQHEAVTLWYRSPDVLLGNTNYSYTADMWSAGCIIAEVASGKAIFHGRNNVDQLKCIFSRLVPPTECNFPSMKRYALCDKFAATLDVLHTGISHQNSNGAGVNSPFDGVKESLYSYFRSYEALDVVGEDGVDLLTHLLAYEPKYRFTVEEALQHPFFTTLSRSVSPAPELRTFSAPHLMEEERRSSLMSGRNARDSESQRAELRAKSLCLPSECQEVAEGEKDGPFTEELRSDTVTTPSCSRRGPKYTSDRDLSPRVSHKGLAKKDGTGVVISRRRGSHVSSINGCNTKDVVNQPRVRMSLRKFPDRPQSTRAAKESKVGEKRRDAGGVTTRPSKSTSKVCVVQGERL